MESEVDKKQTTTTLWAAMTKMISMTLMTLEVVGEVLGRDLGRVLMDSVDRKATILRARISDLNKNRHLLSKMMKMMV